MRWHARAGRLFACLAILALTSLAFLLPSTAMAATSVGCPSPIHITVANGGSFQIDASSCDSFGTNPQDRVVQPAHGTVTIDDASKGLLTYVHNGDSSTSDSFTFEDASRGVVTVIVTIRASISPLTINPGTLPTPTIAVRYPPQSLSATGGIEPYSFDVSGGSLPPGLSLSPDGVISGMPKGSGPYSFTIRATDSTAGTALTGTKSYSLTVPLPTLVVSPTSPAEGTKGFAYSQQFSTSGGTEPITYQIMSIGGLPAGLSLTGDGLLHGTPTVSGSFPLVLRATDSTTTVSGARVFKDEDITLTINAVPSITLSPPPLSAAAVATGYNATITASGGTGPYRFAVTSGALPPGLTLAASGSASSATLSGTPTGGGNYNFTITATDSSGGPGPFSGSQAYSLSVAAPTLSIGPATLSPQVAGHDVDQLLTASGGTPGYAFAVTAGALPAGLTLTSVGHLAGKPTVNGDYNFTITATDSSTGTGPFAGSRAYSLRVDAPAIAIAPSSLLNGTAGTAYSQNLMASGGTAPYVFAITAGALPQGLTLVPDGNDGARLSGTPTAAGSFNFTITATDSTGAGFSIGQAYAVTIAAPSITLTPTSLPDGTAGTDYKQNITASGGTTPYRYAVTSGALPPGLTFVGDDLSGNPTTAGTFDFTITATDSTGAGYSGSQAYSLTIAAPSIALTPASLPGATAGTAYSASLGASGGVTPYSYQVASGSDLPPGLTLSAAGVLSGTPTAAGTFESAIEAVDSLGFAGSRIYHIVVAANPPLPGPVSAETLEGQPVTIDVGALGTGTISSASIVTAPANGTASVSGLTILYTPNASFTGADALQYVLAGPGGTSTPATIAITVHAVPVAAARQVSTASATPVTVDLAAGASGGPFTAAHLVAVPPASAGTAQLNGFQLSFTPAPAFAGAATVTFTLSNDNATSAVTAITITVAERPDPTRDADVMGLLNAQTAATRRFVGSQIGNFQERLEALHDFADAGEITDDVAFVQGVVIAVDNSCGAFDPVAQAAGSCAGIEPAADPLWRAAADPHGLAASGKPAADAPAPSHSRLTVWTGGAINFGSNGGSDGFDFQTTGLSAGIDYRVARDVVLGVGGGYGHDISDVGNGGSRSTGSSYSAAIYGSYQPGRHLFFDGVAGYQWLSFDPERQAASDGGSADGHRDGTQWFASLSAGGKFALDAWRITPYARLDLARASLDAYTEDGDPVTALHYGQQDVDTTTGNLGLTVDYDYVAEFGTVSPQLRLQYQHDFQGDSKVTMNYADLANGPFYSAAIAGMGQDRFLLGIGLNIQTTDDIAVRLEYRGLLDSNGDTDNGVLVNLGASF